MDSADTPITNLQYSRTGLEMLHAALMEAYIFVPSKTDLDAFIDAQIQRIGKIINQFPKD